MILITGAAGFIGSHVARKLDRLGVGTLLFDRTINSTLEAKQGVWIQGDLADRSKIKLLFDTYEIRAVMHFAAFIDVGESMRDPAKYYINNVTTSLCLFEAMRHHQVNYCIFSSSAAIFGEPASLPISEIHPCAPINPYGESKWMVEKILNAYDSAYELKSICLRYFNAAGGDPEGKIVSEKKQEIHLIPIALNCMRMNKPFTIFGTDYPTPDGSCIRDYIHVEDISDAHILALEQLLSDPVSRSYNLGNGKGYSVLEVIATIEKVTGRKLQLIRGPRRAGDPPILVADCAKARSELNWQPRYSDLETMISHSTIPQ